MIAVYPYYIEIHNLTNYLMGYMQFYWSFSESCIPFLILSTVYLIDLHMLYP